MKKIYFDNHATTELDPEVAAFLAEELLDGPSNPSSMHSYGQKAKTKLERARSEIENFVKIPKGKAVFTASATEAVNWILRMRPWKHIVTTEIEHASIFETCKILKTAISYVKVDKSGYATSESIEKALTKESDLLILSAVNSETGSKINLEKIGALGELYPHLNIVLDGVALVGREPLNLPPNIKAFIFSSHKIHGPKGAAALVHAPSLGLTPWTFGGFQEKGLRSGTENLFAILGFAKAVALIEKNGKQYQEHLYMLQSHFEERLLKELRGVCINGEERVASCSNISFPGISAETLLIALDRDGIAASHGSACSSGSMELSRILLQMGIERELVKSSIRFSFGRLNTLEEVNYVVDQIIKKICIE